MPLSDFAAIPQGGLSNSSRHVRIVSALAVMVAAAADVFMFRGDVKERVLRGSDGAVTRCGMTVGDPALLNRSSPQNPGGGGVARS